MMGCFALNQVVCLRVLPLVLLAGLSGCSWILDDRGLIQDRRYEYRKARTLPVPEITEGLDNSRIQELMPIDEVSGMDRYLEEERFELPRPATLFAREADKGVRLQRFDGASWIVVPDPPADIWPRVKQFLSDNGVTVLREDPSEGVIISDWIHLEGESHTDLVRTALSEGSEPAPWYQLKFRVEQAVRHAATELHITEASRAEPGGGLSDFTSGSTDPEAESGLLSVLAEYLAAELGGTGVSFVAQTIAVEAKLEIIRSRNAPPVLRIRLPFERAWATVATALENAEILVEESDQETRIHQIHFNDRQFHNERPGWLARLFGAGTKAVDEAGVPYILRLDDSDDGLELRVLDENSESVAREIADQILSVLREFAS